VWFCGHAELPERYEKISKDILTLQKVPESGLRRILVGILIVGRKYLNIIGNDIFASLFQAFAVSLAND